MKLHYKKTGNGNPVIILHGLFGMLDNWTMIAKELAENFTVYLVDQRNHGRSPHDEQFNYEVMAEDLMEFMENENLDSAHIIGHSLGGKTAMKFAQNNPNYIEKLIVVDIAPKVYPVHHDEIIAALKSVNLTHLKRRTEADETLKQSIKEESIRQFLLKSLYWKSKGELAWRFNLKTIANNIENVGQENHDRQFNGETLFIKGGSSSYILKEDIEDIKLIFPNAKVREVPNADHWVHAEQPKVFLQIVTDFLFD